MVVCCCANLISTRRVYTMVRAYAARSALCSIFMVFATFTPVHAQHSCEHGQPAFECEGLGAVQIANPMVLTRTMVRELADGRSLTVRRSWQLHFEREPDGYSVTGNRIGVEVDAPPQLAYLADIEKARDDDRAFKLKLDNSGLIADLPNQSVATRSAKGGPADIASRQAIRSIERQGLPENQEQRAAYHLRTIVKLASESPIALPPDFFFPRRLEWHRDITGGPDIPAPAMMQVDFRAERSPDTGLLHRSRREISTRIGDSERKTTELWELESPNDAQGDNAAN